MTGGVDDDGLELFPVTIGEYKAHPRLEVDEQVATIHELLAEFDPELVDWPLEMDRRGSDAVQDRLDDWAATGAGGRRRNTLLYWAGHGWSNGDNAALAHHRSPVWVGTNGLTPTQLAEKITARERVRDDDDAQFAIVVIDACCSKRFVQLLNAELEHNSGGARRVLLIATADDASATRLGNFTHALRVCLQRHFPNVRRIELWDFAKQLNGLQTGLTALPSPALFDAALVRVGPPITAPQPLDARDELQRILAGLSEDERQHFIPKAQGAEFSDALWLFEGRDDERDAVVNWLATHRSGMLIVTGRAGTGKSALLGNILAASRPALREILARPEFQPDIAKSPCPEDDVFDIAMLLTGATVDRVVTRIGLGLNLGEPPAADVSTRIDWLLDRIKAHNASLTLLVDAMDEAAHPLGLAQSLLSRLASTDNVRLIVGTRQSTSDEPDGSGPDNQNLIDALVATCPAHQVLTVRRDVDAITRYIRRRLADVRTDDGVCLDPERIEQVAGLVLGDGREFLYARLAVHELVACPSLLLSKRADDLAYLLGGDHQRLFGAAIDRIAENRADHRPLLEALAHGLGRGLPGRDRIWTTVAGALSDDGPVSETSVDDVLAAAAPYILLDNEQEQSVYRMAHRTFQDFFLRPRAPQPGEDRPETAPHGPGDAPRTTAAHQDAREVAEHGAALAAKRQRIAEALLDDAENADPDKPLNPYLVTYLSGHIAAAGPDAWRHLAKRPALLDRLDPQAVGADAFRTLFGRTTMPPEIAGLMGTRHLMMAASPRDRRGLREIGMARYAGVNAFRPPDDGRDAADWSLRWAHVAPRPTHMTLAGHHGPVEAVAISASGRVISAGVDRRIRIWDAATGAQLNRLSGHTGSVRAVAVGLDGSLVSGSDDRTIRVWDLVTGRQLGLLRGHTGPVRALAVAGDGRVVSGGEDNLVRIWDTAAGTSRVLKGHDGPVEALAITADHRVISAGSDATVRIWDLDSGRPLGLLRGHAGPVRALAVAGDGQVVSCGIDATVRVWDGGTGVSRVLQGHDGAVEALAITADHRIISAGSDATIRVWDLATGRHLNRLDGHERGALAVTVTSDGRIISGGVDATVRVWDAATSAHLALEGHTGVVEAVAVGGDGLRAVSGGADATVRIWETATGDLRGLLREHTGPVRAVAVTGDGWRVVSASDDLTLRVWDLATGTRVGLLPGHAGPVRAVAVAGDGRIVSAGDDGTIRVWHATTYAHLTRLHGHNGPITAVTTLPDGRIISGGDDATVRIWDSAAGTSQVLEGHCGPVRALAVGDHGCIVSAGEDNTVRVWDTATGADQVLSGHRGWVQALAVTPEGDVISGSDDGTARLWYPADDGWRAGWTVPVAGAIRSVAATRDGFVVVGDQGILALCRHGPR